MQNHEPGFDLPDPAIGPRTTLTERRTVASASPVHNVGVKAVEQLLVRVTNEAGELIVEQTIASIPVPLDFHAKAVVADIPNLRTSRGRS